MTTEAAPLQAANNMLDCILNADASLLSLETREIDALVEQFRSQVRHSGQAVYQWQENDGLRSLRETGVRVPGCLRLGDTLRYVLKSMHFGIYLVTGMTLPLNPSHLSLLRRIARTRTDFVRRVVLLSDGPELAQRLGDLATPLQHAQASEMPLRLRDGRWVV